MPLTEKDLQEVREQIQNDLICISDGLQLGQDVTDNICQVVVDRFSPLLTKVNS